MPNGDPVLRHHGQDFKHAPSLSWIGYLSTVGVYGDSQGAWIDETTPTQATSTRGRRRIAAETEWLALGYCLRICTCVFRLAGIYGPGRSAIDRLREGTAHRIVKPGQVFNRIHVDDIAAAVCTAMLARRVHEIYNVTDDEPAPPQDVIAYAAELLHMPPPPEIAFEDAELSPMAASFYADNKRIRNTRLRQELGVALKFPTYREGLRAILAEQLARLNSSRRPQPLRHRSAAVQAAPALLAKCSRAFAATFGSPPVPNEPCLRGRYAVNSEWPQSRRDVRRGVDELDV